MKYNRKNVCMVCGYLTDDDFCANCGKGKPQLLEQAFEERKRDTIFKTTLGLLSEIEAAYEVFEQEWKTVMGLQKGMSQENIKRLETACKAYNEVAGKAIPALAEDTKHVNSHDTIKSIFRPSDSLEIIFAPAYLKKIITRNSFR